MLSISIMVLLAIAAGLFLLGLGLHLAARLWFSRRETPQVLPDGDLADIAVRAHQDSVDRADKEWAQYMDKFRHFFARITGVRPDSLEMDPSGDVHVVCQGRVFLIDSDRPKDWRLHYLGTEDRRTRSFERIHRASDLGRLIALENEEILLKSGLDPDALHPPLSN